MYLENVIVDARNPQRLGRFWEAALGAEGLTDAPEGYETRLSLMDGFTLDFGFPRVPDPSPGPARLHLDLAPGPDQAATVRRLLDLGASHLDIGQGDVPWVVLADPEGHPFCVLEDREVYRGTGPVAALVLASADPVRDGRFWSWLTEWDSVPDLRLRTVRHPSGRGPHLELVPETAPAGQEKNPLHLDVRLEAGDDPDDVGAAIIARGGRALDPGWGDLPWRVYADPSGNEFCVLPSRE